MNYLYVAVGSGLGGVARYAAGGWAQQRFDRSFPSAGLPGFPLGTLLVNVSGSFLLGVLAVAIARRGVVEGDAARLLLAVGLCGGYTTFSTFTYDTVALAERGRLSLAALNVAASVVLGLVFMLAGILLARRVA